VADRWQKLLLRLRQVTGEATDRHGHGVAVIRVSLIVRDGHLVGWNRPQATLIEPSGLDAADALIRVLTSGPMPEHIDPVG
jgi:hypothetical protein